MSNTFFDEVEAKIGRTPMDDYDYSIAALHQDPRFAGVSRGAVVMLEAMGLDLGDKNLSGTPRRIAQVLLHFTKAQNAQAQVVAMLKQRSFPGSCDQIITQAPIKAHGICPHHFVPVRYEVSMGYMPKKGGLVVGLDKIARAVRFLALQLILQEDYPERIADALTEALEPRGVGIVVVGHHGCITARGVEQDIVTTNSVMRGVFRDEPDVKSELLYLLNVAIGSARG